MGLGKAKPRRARSGSHRTRRKAESRRSLRNRRITALGGNQPFTASNTSVRFHALPCPSRERSGDSRQLTLKLFDLRLTRGRLPLKTLGFSRCRGLSRRTTFPIVLSGTFRNEIFCSGS